MGLFDNIRDALTGKGGPLAPRDTSRPSRPPPSPDPAQQNLADAQRKRAAAGVARANGRPATKRNLRTYEQVERHLANAIGFPWTSAEAERALLARGFNPAHVRAYLASPAARRLLE